jgi:hypothetical protein
MTVTRVIDPDGNRWTVRRKWVHRRLRWRGSGSFDLLDGADLLSAGADLPVVGVILTVLALLLLAVGLVLFVVPALIFIGELLLVVAIVGVGLVGRLLFGRPWTVEAHRQGAGHAYEWRARGWGASRDLVRSVGEQLSTTGVAGGGTQVPARSSRPG